MDKELEKSRIAYAGFFKRYNESRDRLGELKNKYADIEFDPDYLMYEKTISSPSLSEEEKEKIKADTYKPEWEEIEKEISSLEEKIEPLYKKLKESAVELDTKIQEAIAELNKKIEAKNKEIQEAETNLQKQKDEYTAIIEGEAYKSGDEDEKRKADKLKVDIDYDEKKIQKSKESVKSFTKEVEDWKQKRESIKNELEKIGLGDIIKEDIDPKDAPEDKVGTDPKDSTEGKDDKGKDKKKKGNRSRGGSVPVTPIEDTELSEEEKVKKEKAEQEKKFKEDFEALCKKVKKGKLEPEEFEKILAIMGDKENYDKLGITTGLVFNKAKNIFDSLRKSAKKDAEKMGRIEETFATYQEVFVERNGKKKVDSWYKFFDKVGGIEKKQYQKGLPAPRMESTKPEKSKSPIEKDLEGKRNEPGEENKIPPRKPQTKEEKTI